MNIKLKKIKPPMKLYFIYFYYYVLYLEMRTLPFKSGADFMSSMQLTLYTTANLEMLI